MRMGTAWRTSASFLTAGLLLVGGTACSAADTRANQAVAVTGGGQTWGPCAEAPAEHPARCGRVDVPVDWDAPDGPRLSLRVAKLPAADPQRRIGTLVFNPGGPGGAAAPIVANPQAVGLYFPKKIRDRFDIVGIDPRGVGGSDPVDCALPPHDPEVSRFPVDQAGVRALVDHNERFARSCGGSDDAMVSNLDTVSVARDFDAVRRALGEEKISFLGLSYGTMLAQSYAERFPDSMDAVVLDGVVDRARDPYRMAGESAATLEGAVREFASWCDHEPECAVQDARETIARVRAKADAGELTFRDRPVTDEEVGMAVNTALNMSSGQPELAKALRTAETTGDATPLLSGTAFTMPEFYGPYRAIICQDVPAPDPSELVREGKRTGELNPSLGGTSEFWDIASGCAGWPVRTDWQPHPWQVPEDFEALLLSGAHDVATPRAWAESVHQQIPGSELIRWDGLGHTAWLNDEKARQAGVDYLVEHSG